jgi:hypothetical protein
MNSQYKRTINLLKQGGISIMWSISGLFCIVLGVGFLAALAFLQVLLSSRQNKWFGVFIPALWFLGTIIPLAGNAMKLVGTTIGLFILLNVPTIIYLLIFFACREKVKMSTKS